MVRDFRWSDNCLDFEFVKQALSKHFDMQEALKLEDRWEGLEIREMFSPAPEPSVGEEDSLFWIEIKRSLALRYQNEANFTLS